MSRYVEIVDVSPRDGLQNDPADLSTAQKLTLIADLAACGVRRVEAGAFVSPKAVPKMADSPAVFGGLPPGLRAGGAVAHIALALNETGVRRALEAGADEINFVLVASPGFGVRNQGMTPEQSLAALTHIAPLVAEAGLPLTATISVAFGDPFDGEVPVDAVAALAAGAAQAGVQEIALGDTIGVADPVDVRRRMAAVRENAPDARLRLHFHNTRNTGLANVFAAVEAGADVIDASLGGVGGCPFAPRATGNVATEDVVYLLHRAGYDTGLDLQRLITAAQRFESALGHPVASALARAGAFPR
jgi:hydroxymethylglutaryl-CoA lyase